MNTRIVALVRGVIALGLIGCLGVQALLVAMLFIDPTETAGSAATARLAAVMVMILGLVCVQVSAVCVWRLLTLVRRGTVFSPAAFRWVDVIIGAIGVASVLVLVLGYILGEVDDAPGVILVGAVLALLVAGVALIVYVQRMLLAQATGFSAELEAVI